MIEWSERLREDGAVEVRLRGSITEVADFSGLSDLSFGSGGARVALVADGVRFINSTGVLRFGDALARLAASATVTLERCSPTMVAQLNMIPSLLEGVTVSSVMAPLECSECVAEVTTLIQLNDAGGVPEVPARACEVCGSPLQLAELESRYFAFLS